MKTIKREQIKAKLDNHEPITLIEALPKKYFDEAHLPGAININTDEIRLKAADALPDREAFVVVYCANAACGNSSKAARILEQLGYSNVHEYVEGKEDWLAAKLPIESTDLAVAV